MPNKTNICIMQKASGGGTAYDMYLYDDITKYGTFDFWTWEYTDSETSAEYFRKQLEAIPDDAEINLFINSDGGDVYEATAIYNMLRRHSGKITGYVDGRAHSAAFTVLQAADHRVMGLGTSAIIHNMWTACIGNAADMRKAADDLDAMMDSCVQLLMDRANGITEQELRNMLDAETVLTPETALKYGFIDEIADYKKDSEEDDEDEKDAEIRELKQRVNQLSNELNTRFKQKTKQEFDAYAGKKDGPAEDESKEETAAFDFGAFLNV